MPIDTHSLIEQKQVANDIFACIYRRAGLLMLRLSHADGSVVNPQRMGFVLQNLTWNQRNMEGGVNEEVYFVLLTKERYSLRLHGKEVWSYGEEPNLGPGLSEVVIIPKEEEAKREQTFNNILNFLSCHTQTRAVHVSGSTVLVTEDTKNVTFIDSPEEDTSGIPWDPKLFGVNNYPRSGSSSGYSGASAN